MSVKKPLSQDFQAHNYTIEKHPQESLVFVKITGLKTGKPSKRIAFHQQNIKVNSATVVSSRKGKEIEHNITRINHLPRSQEVRLHSANMLYPGKYEIRLEFYGSEDVLKELISSPLVDINLRRYIPSIDEPDQKSRATFNLG
jgi:aminopeptidase N